MPTVIGLPGKKGITSVPTATIGPGGRKISWHPERLKAAAISAVGPAAHDAEKLARAASPSSQVSSMMFTTVAGAVARVGSKSPLARLLSAGARPHDIGAPNQRLKIGENVRMGPVHHPGFTAKPFLAVLPPAWPGLYRARARAALRAS